MTSCPTCNKPVDPIRARSVGVRDGKVVAYCSAECAAAAESRPVKSPVAPTATPVAATPTPVAAKPTPVAAKPAPLPATPSPAKSKRGGGGKVKAAASDYDSGPVIEILHEPASGVVTSAPDRRDSASEADASGKTASAETGGVIAGDDRDETDAKDDDAAAAVGAAVAPGGRTQRQRRDSLDSKAGWEWLDDEPAEMGRRKNRSPDGEPAPRGKGLLVAIFVFVLLGVGGYFVYRYVQGKKAPAEAAAPRIESVEQIMIDAAPAAPEPGVELAATVERAKEVLRGHLASRSTNVQKFSAGALARTGDKEAVEALAKLLETAPSGKLEIAYMLARSGDSRGLDFLVKSLKGERSDKLDAASRLARLHDDRAVEPLAQYLSIAQNKFAAARYLAGFRDARAIKMFEQIRADQTASPDDKVRATIGLGFAGNHDVAGELQQILASEGTNQEAAAALVALQDPAAKPMLVEQLASPVLRQDAARLLRLLEPNLDAAPLVKPLLEQLGAATGADKPDPDKTKSEVNQIHTAEAILLLAGPPAWAEKP